MSMVKKYSKVPFITTPEEFQPLPLFLDPPPVYQYLTFSNSKEFIIDIIIISLYLKWKKKSSKNEKNSPNTNWEKQSGRHFLNERHVETWQKKFCCLLSLF